jgi:hypothetical protein
MKTTATAQVATIETTSQRVGRYRWVICALLFFATTVNYVDRQVLGILAKDLQRPRRLAGPKSITETSLLLSTPRMRSDFCSPAG